MCQGRWDYQAGDQLAEGCPFQKQVKVQNREVSSSDAFAVIFKKASCRCCAWGKNNMLVVEIKGTRAITCKSDQTSSALCFSSFFNTTFVPSPTAIEKQNKTNPYYKVQKSILYFSINLERCNCPASQCCFKKHCRFLGSLLQSRSFLASKPHKIFPLFSVYMPMSFGIWRC